jgi:hypothetical protein
VDVNRIQLAQGNIYLMEGLGIDATEPLGLINIRVNWVMDLPSL